MQPFHLGFEYSWVIKGNHHSFLLKVQGKHRSSYSLKPTRTSIEVSFMRSVFPSSRIITYIPKDWCRNQDKYLSP